MKKRSQFVSTILAGAVLISNPETAAFADSWVAPQPNTAPSNGSWVVVNENGGFDLWSTRQSHPSNSKTSEAYLCRDGLGENECDFTNPAWIFRGSQILPYCESSTQENCLAGLSATTSDGTVVKGRFLRTVAGERWKAVPETGLYEGTMPSLFEITDVKNGGGTSTYVVVLKTQLEFNASLKQFQTRSMSANVFAYSSISSGASTTRTQARIDPDGISRVYQMHDPNCLFTDTGICGIEQDFPKGVAFQLDARVSKDLSGWFHGRMTEQEISITQFSTNNNLISVHARPATVARLAVVATKENSSLKAQELLLSRGGHGGYTAFNGNSIKDFWATEGDGSFFALNEWRDDMKDSAAGISTVWNFATVGRQPGNECMADKTKVLGIVTTNATIYSGSAPIFVNGQLKYTVGGLHYQPDGKTLNEGTYDLLIRSEVARCLYGFSKAPISATIQVTGEGGENRVATTVIKESADGWLKLAAYGFNFSSPTISVQLTQAKAVTKKTTITCVSVKNKKLTKKISAVAPKCPTGYKKK